MKSLAYLCVVMKGQTLIILLDEKISAGLLALEVKYHYID